MLGARLVKTEEKISAEHSCCLLLYYSIILKTKVCHIFGGQWIAFRVLAPKAIRIV